MPSLRQQLRKKRRSLTRSEQVCASAALCRLLVTDIAMITADRIAFYLPNDGEIDPTRFLSWCHAAGKQIYLPVVPEGLMANAPSLFFQAYTPGLTILVNNRFGVPEPLFDRRKCIRASLLNLVLMPLVGFDRKGNRIGMGKGYYDKTFSTRIPAFRSPRLVGLAHSVQETAIVPDPWGIPLDAVFTEKEKISIRRV
jgi:5-formyltetrahydrofolate cyclo-ligase